MSKSNTVSKKNKDNIDRTEVLPELLTTTRLFVGISIGLLLGSAILLYGLTKGFIGLSVQHYILWSVIATLFIVTGMSCTKLYKKNGQIDDDAKKR